MNSLKRIVEKQKIKEVNNDMTYKFIAISIVAGLLVFAYWTSIHGFGFIPGLGLIFNEVLRFFNSLVETLSNWLFQLFANL